MSYAILRPAVLLGKEWPIFPLPPRLAYWATRVIGWYVGDVFLTWEELKGLMAGTLEVDTPPTGTMKNAFLL